MTARKPVPDRLARASARNEAILAALDAPYRKSLIDYRMALEAEHDADVRNPLAPAHDRKHMAAAVAAREAFEAHHRVCLRSLACLGRRARLGRTVAP